MSETQRAIIGLGSNIDPMRAISAALKELDDLAEAMTVSTIYWSEPVGRTDQPAFLNGAVLIETPLSPMALKQSLLAIEDSLGRVRDPDDPCGPRTIDLDLIIYEDRVDPFVDVPSADIEKRWFVTIPAAELWPDWVHPTSGAALVAIAETLQDARDGEPVELI